MKKFIITLIVLALSSCQSQSDIDSDFLVGPFNNLFNFANSSQYNFDASKIDFTNGVAELTPSQQTDNSDTTAGFGGGTPIGTAWNSAHSLLILDHSGSATDFELDPSWTPQWSELVGYWKLNGTPGAVAASAVVPDSSGHGADATMSGGGDTYVAGRLGQGLNVQGFYSGADVPAAYANPCTTMTMGFWWKGTAPGTYSNVISKNGFTAASPGYDVQAPGWNNSLVLRIDTSAATSQGVAWNTNDNFFDGNWHYATFTLDSGNAVLYYDGQIDTTGTYLPGTGFCNSTQGLDIGLNQAGVFDDVAVWDVALTPAAIATIYQHETSAHTGTFTSRVMDGLVTPANWTSLSWSSTLPFLKEIPDGTVSETQNDYSSQTEGLLSQIKGLWHLDGALGPIASGATVYDSSGNNANGTMIGASGSYVVGQLGQGLLVPGGYGNYVSVPANKAPDPCSDMTVGFWWNSAATSVAFGTLLNKNDGTLGYSVQTQNGNNSLYVRIDTSAGNNQIASWNASDNFFDGTWHYIAFTLSAGNFILYKDGVQDETGTYLAGGGVCNSTRVLNIGSSFAGVFDEVAIWSRVLGDNEILELYRRGANRVKYQIRTCSDSACAANPLWHGPDNTDQTYFTELNNNAVQNDGGDLTLSDSVQPGLPSMLFSHFGSLAVTPKRYFQYRAILESDDNSMKCNYASGSTWCSPELKSTTIGPEHYDTSNPTITNKTGLGYQTLTGFLETLGSSGCSSGTLYTISPDNSHWYYWSGAAWGLADGTTAKANSASTIANNLSTFTAQIGVGSLYFKTFLQSSGISSCSIGQLEIDGTR